MGVELSQNQLSSDAGETDTKQTHSTRILIPPDSNIGIPLHYLKEKNVLVQVSPVSSCKIQLVNMICAHCSRFP